MKVTVQLQKRNLVSIPRNVRIKLGLKQKDWIELDVKKVEEDGK
jgi:bifunctional DNA-binding transcriptional regulator/antitoxin component of YhaV-PrlF toxin-antitoxin module